MSNLESALAYVQAHREEHLKQYLEYLSIPSISTQPAHKKDMLRAAEWLTVALREIGMEGVAMMETPGHPVVYGESLKAAGKPTVLVYGHYDVQPVDPLDEWESDPFGGEIRGDYIYGRGASDMKGQLLAHLKGMEALVKHGGCPVNIKYLLEGEEEIGSPNLGRFIDDNKEKLACDFVLNCDAGIHTKDVPSITYALRGLAYFEVKIEGAVKDVHSGTFGGTVRNPIHVLAELIAGLHDADGRITLPGFYDGVRELDAEERTSLARIPQTDEEWMEMAGTTALFGEKGYTTIERAGARPALDVNGIWGGYTEEGAKTVLPARASAKLSTRLVADQDPKAIKGQLEAYLKANTPAEFTWTVHEHSAGPGSTMDRKSVYVQAAAKALEEVFGIAPLFTREGGSVPVVGLMQKQLGVDTVMFGFALSDDGIHGPNERQYLPNIYRGIEAHIRFLSALGEHDA